MALDAGTALKRPILYPGRKRGYDFTLRAIASSADVRQRFRTGAKVCGVPIIILLVIAALGPAKWVPRSELGWQFDHFGYFGITLFFCFAWPRPFLVGGIFMAAATLLEGLQAFTPDRNAYLPAALDGAGGALAAALVVGLLIRAWRWHRCIVQNAKVARPFLKAEYLVTRAQGIPSLPPCRLTRPSSYFSRMRATLFDAQSVH